MDNNTEKYGIELDLLITKFKNKVNQVKNDIKGLGQQAKANVGDIEVDINMKTLEKDIANVKAQIQSLNEQMQEYQKYGYTSSPLYKSLAKDLDVATQKLKAYEKAQEEANRATEEAEVVSAKSTISIGNGFNRLTKKISRYALSLFSLGTIYSLVSRASSAYLTQDVELANKLQSAWVGLGAILAPIIEKMANYIIKLVSYINVFAQALTGVNYIAKATSKYMNAVASSAKEANKQLASFDELTNLASETSSTGTTSNPFDAFDDVELDDSIVKKLQDMAYWLKENWNWIKLVGEVLIATFAISKLAGVISSIGKVTTALGSTGLMGALTPFLTLGAIAITFYIAGNIKSELAEIEEYTKKIRDYSKEAREEWLKTDPTLEKLYDTMKVNNNSALEALEESESWLNKILGLSDDYLENAKNVVILSGENLDYMIEQYNQGTLNEEQLKNLYNQLKEQLNVNQQIITKLEEEGINTEELVSINKRYAQFTYDIYQNMLNQGYAQDDVLKALGLTESEIKSIYDYTKNNVATINIDGNTSDLRKELNDTLDDANKDYSNFFTNLADKLGSFFTTLFGGSSSKLTSSLSALKNIKRPTNNLASFDVGTNYVPSDMVANVHKGEAIIPKKFNNKEFLSNMGGNEETNALLNDVLNAINNIDFNPYITVKDVGKASVSYINEQNRYQGRSVIK